MLTTADFKKLLKQKFIPYIRELGFKGTGTRFYKITENHFIHSFVIQANRYGGSCVIELGVYMDFLPDSLGRIIEPKKVSPYDCEFTARMSPKSGWWEYGSNEKEALLTIDSMIETFSKEGLKYFEQFNDFPEPLVDIKLEEIINGSSRLESLGAPLGLRIAMTIGAVHLYLGNKQESNKFAEWGLQNIGQASLLIDDFKRIKSGEYFNHYKKV